MTINTPNQGHSQKFEGDPDFIQIFEFFQSRMGVGSTPLGKWEKLENF